MNSEEKRRRVAFHESGHAVASVRRGGYVKYIDLTKAAKELQETFTDDEPADKAFMIWAGPWAQARWEGNCTTDRIKEIFQTQSFFDWPLYEERFGKNVRTWAREANEAKDFNDSPPQNVLWRIVTTECTSAYGRRNEFRRNPPLRRRDGEEMPLAGHAFELVSAAILELEP